VRTVRDNPSLVQVRAGAGNQANAANSTKAGAGQAGDVYLPKIAGVKAYREPSEGAVVTTLGKTDGVIYGGEEKDGFMKVETGSGTAWVKVIMMKKE
jgi:hypothetical protein